MSAEFVGEESQRLESAAGLVCKGFHCVESAAGPVCKGFQSVESAAGVVCAGFHCVESAATVLREDLIPGHLRKGDRVSRFI